MSTGSFPRRMLLRPKPTSASSVSATAAKPARSIGGRGSSIVAAASAIMNMTPKLSSSLVLSATTVLMAWGPDMLSRSIIPARTGSPPTLGPGVMKLTAKPTILYANKLLKDICMLCWLQIIFQRTTSASMIARLTRAYIPSRCGCMLRSMMRNSLKSKN